MKHEAAKPIVPGCLCIVLPQAGLHAGMVCTAIRQLPMNAMDFKGDKVGGHWLTDLPPMVLEGKPKQFCVRESYLMRIDDPDNQIQIASERPVEKVCP